MSRLFPTGRPREASSSMASTSSTPHHDIMTAVSESKTKALAASTPQANFGKPWDFLTLTKRGAEPTTAVSAAGGVVDDKRVIPKFFQGCGVSVHDVKAISKRSNDPLSSPKLDAVDDAAKVVIDDVKPWLERFEAILKMTKDPAVRQLGIAFLEAEIRNKIGLGVGLAKPLEGVNDSVTKYGAQAAVFINMLSATLEDLKNEGVADFTAEQLKVGGKTPLRPTKRAVNKAQEPQLGVDAIEFLLKHPEIFKLVAKHPEALEFLMKHPQIIKHVLKHPDALNFLMSNPGLIDWILPGGSKRLAGVDVAELDVGSVSTTVENIVAHTAPEEKSVDALSKRSIDTAMLALSPAPSHGSLFKRSVVGRPHSSLAAAGNLAANDRIGGVFFLLFTVLMLII